METIVKQNSSFVDILAVARTIVKKLGTEKSLAIAKRCSVLRAKYKGIRSYNTGELACQIRRICVAI